jgi:N-acetylneuraminate synthase
MSFHQALKQMPDFMDEFVGSYFAEPTLPPLFGEIDGQRMGFLRFRVYDDSLPASIPRACDIGVMVHSDYRNQGLGQQLVALGTEFVHNKGWQTVIAEIRQENDASVRLFRKAGYRKLDTHQRAFDDLSQPVTVLRYVHHQAVT